LLSGVLGRVIEATVRARHRPLWDLCGRRPR
jgi:hypothetical protein